MPTYEVPGAMLHYDTFGEGPVLLLIPGAEGRGSIFHEIAKHLSEKFTVVCLTRRGFSQSHLHGVQDLNNHVSVDADDAQLLIKHLSPEPAYVFGSSSGAVVAQRLLERHPEVVKMVMSYEPPSLSVLPEDYKAQGLGMFQSIYDIYRAKGPEAAIEIFGTSVGCSDDGPVLRHALDSKRSDEIRANVMFWFEFELMQTVSGPVNLELLEAAKDKLIPLAGIESGDAPITAPIATIAGMLGKELLRVPGGHLGYQTATDDFAKAIIKMTA